MAATSNDISGGISAKARSGAATYSANAPWLNGKRSAKTRSPGLNRVTPGPTDSTTPATSIPMRGFLGRRTPRSRRTNSGLG